MFDYLTMEQAAKAVPVKVAVCTVWRWCVKGIRVRRTGQTIKLRCIYVGRKMYTKNDWLEEFGHRLAAAKLGPHQPVWTDKPRPHHIQRMDPAEVDAILERAGI